MGFELHGHYVWDFWIARDRHVYHLFFLTARKTAEHPDLRHPRARIGHATSTNLRDWRYEGIALGPSDVPAWDDGVTWTGSVIKRPDGKWMMFYTGCGIADMKVQRIGAALSDDLFTWTKIEGPLFEADPERYETYDPGRWHDQAWRDPWVYPNPSGAGWCMLFTARERSDPAKGAGVIGLAVSEDLLAWSAKCALFRIGYYGEMEVPQLFPLDGWWYCLFSNSVRHREPAYIVTGKAGRVTGTHYLRSRAPEGPFHLVEEEFMAGDDAGRLYGGKVVEQADGTFAFMAFLNHDEDGGFVGRISDPMPVWTTPGGLLRVDASGYGVPRRPDGVRASSGVEPAAGDTVPARIQEPAAASSP